MGHFSSPFVGGESNLWRIYATWSGGVYSWHGTKWRRFVLISVRWSRQVAHCLAGRTMWSKTIFQRQTARSDMCTKSSSPSHPHAGADGLIYGVARGRDWTATTSICIITWLLTTGHWTLATGHWPLTTGHWKWPKQLATAFGRAFEQWLHIDGAPNALLERCIRWLIWASAFALLFGSMSTIFFFGWDALSES